MKERFRDKIYLLSLVQQSYAEMLQDSIRIFFGMTRKYKQASYYSSNAEMVYLEKEYESIKVQFCGIIEMPETLEKLTVLF